MPASETRTSYHHGALRGELITACIALIEAEGIGAVSLRRVARAAGVSAGAPYYHFPDRAALFAAIAARGYNMLESQLSHARHVAPTATRGLGAQVEAYVGFARDYPAYLQVMLRPELSQPEKHPEAEAAAEAALQVLAAAVQDCQREGTAPPGDPSPLVAMVWALATGIVTLWLDGPLESRCATMGTTPEKLTARITSLLESMLEQRQAT